MNTLHYNRSQTIMKSLRTACSSLCLFLCVLSSQAQVTLKARDAFSQMPDSILPYLTANNRLDMLDFKDSHMQARVQNKFDGYSELLTLPDDSLTIQMSSVMQLTLRILTTDKEIDGSHQIISIERNYSQTLADADGKSHQRIVRHQNIYSVLWRKIDDESIGMVK